VGLAGHTVFDWLRDGLGLRNVSYARDQPRSFATMVDGADALHQAAA